MVLVAADQRGRYKAVRAVIEHVVVGLAVLVAMKRMRVIFFFSSRRRHTRYWRDWSSDVCSSDLGGGAAGGRGLHAAGQRGPRERVPARGPARGGAALPGRRGRRAAPARAGGRRDRKSVV